MTFCHIVNRLDELNDVVGWNEEEMIVKKYFVYHANACIRMLHHENAYKIA